MQSRSVSPFSTWARPVPHCASSFATPHARPIHACSHYTAPTSSVHRTALLTTTRMPCHAHILNPNPAIQLLYCPTSVAHSFAGSSLELNSMHSSRAAFSSVHTQQGFTFCAAAPLGLRSAARLFVLVGCDAEMGLVWRPVMWRDEV
jgi:hypothetical protein